MAPSSAHLLIVCKDENNLTALGEMLHELAMYEVTIINTPTQGEQLVMAQTFDIVLLDIGLEQKAVAQFLEHALQHVAAPVIVAGHINDIPLLTQCVQDGAKDYLLLPTNSTLLKARLNRIYRRNDCRNKP